MSVGDDDYEIHQSPGLLSSNASSGTTGAVLWKITPLVAEWLLQPDNVFFKHGILNSQSHIVELGCGVSGLISLAVNKRVGKYIATDLDYVLRGLKKNLEENGVLRAEPQGDSRASASNARHTRRQKTSKGKTAGKKAGEVHTLDLDWTKCTSRYLRENLQDPTAVDCILACDCIYNEALVEPFVQTCVDLCTLREQPTICIVAQQLRSDLVFEAWLKAFIQRFHVYHVPDNLLAPSIHRGSGYAIHVGLAKEN